MDFYNIEPKKINYPIQQDLVWEIYKEIKDQGFYEFLDSDQTVSDIFIKSPFIGYVLYQIQNQETRKKLQEIAEKLFNTKMHGGQITFAKYTRKSGGYPILHAHYDKFGEYPTLAMSIQLNNTVGDWKFGVDETTHYICRDRAVIYSGTHQIHYREFIEFFDHSYCDVILCQFFPEEDGKPVLIEDLEKHKKIMEYKLEAIKNNMPESFCTDSCLHRSPDAPEWASLNAELVKTVTANMEKDVL